MILRIIEKPLDKRAHLSRLLSKGPFAGHWVSLCTCSPADDHLTDTRTKRQCETCENQRAAEKWVSPPTWRVDPIRVAGTQGLMAHYRMPHSPHVLCKHVLSRFTKAPDSMMLCLRCASTWEQIRKGR